MNREIISEAMGNISSRHIKEAAEFKAEEKPHRNKNAWMRWVSIAACFCLIVVAAFTVIPMLNNTPGNGNEIVDNVLPTDIDKIIWSKPESNRRFLSAFHRWVPHPVAPYNRLGFHQAGRLSVLSCVADFRIATVFTLRRSRSFPAVRQS